MASHPRCNKTPRAHACDTRKRPKWHTRRPSEPLSSTSPAARFAPLVAVTAALLLILMSVDLEPVDDVHDAGTPGFRLPAVGVMTDASTEGDVWAGIPIPPQPGPGQETKCDPASAEVAINGACYVQTSSEPPCPGKQYEHAGKCWIAVGKRKPAGRAIEQQPPHPMEAP